MLRTHSREAPPGCGKTFLLGEHRNYALCWLGSASVASLPLAVWAAAAPDDQGQSYALSIGLALFSVAAITLVLKLWSGPFSNRFPSATAWLARRRATRRS